MAEFNTKREDEIYSIEKRIEELDLKSLARYVKCNNYRIGKMGMVESFFWDRAGDVLEHYRVQYAQQVLAKKEAVSSLEGLFGN